MAHEDDNYLDGFLSSAFASTGALDSDVGGPLDDEEVPERIGRYPVVERIGCGGVGLVYRVQDPNLGRHVAIKVLRANHAADPKLVERFRDEARVCGRMTHPGVVTIYESGELEDDQPYLAMKLIEGSTLATLLGKRDRVSATHDLIEVFEKTCQAIAYAHDRGVVHGDLKPQNIMVGEFGEVQVMDWGFSHELDGEPGVKLDIAEKRRTGGTPAYMAPEQSRTSELPITKQTDVFGLGGILCEVLTGSPPYTGETREEVYLRATRGWQDEAIARLRDCDADQRLVRLARECLAPDPADRPAGAAAVAREVAAFQADLQERARRLEIEAAEARVTAGQQRRARRLTSALSGMVVTVIVVIAGAILWTQSEASARTLGIQRSVETALAEAVAAETKALAGGEHERSEWDAALAAVRRAAEFAKHRDADASLAERVAGELVRIERESTAAFRSRRLAERLEELRPHMGDDRDVAELDADYAAAFAEAGVVPDQPVADVARTVAASRNSEVFIAALDQWSRFRRTSRIEKALTWRRLDEIARTADSDPWRNRLRVAIGKRDKRTLRGMARELRASEHAAESLDLLATCLSELGDRETAIEVYRAAVAQYPHDYQLTHNLATQLEWGEDPSRDEITRLAWAGVALRPRNAHALTDLGLALTHAREFEQALVFLDRAQSIRPNVPRTCLLRGAALAGLNRFAEAAEAYGIAVDGGATRVLLPYGMVLQQIDRLDDALVVLRRARELNPTDAMTTFQLGRLLCKMREHDDGLAWLREAVALDPSHAEAHVNIGDVLVWRGQFEAGHAARLTGHEIGISRGSQWTYPSAIWVDNAANYIRLSEHLDRWLAGEIEDPGSIECAHLARTALRRGLGVQAAELFRDALAELDELPESDNLQLSFEAGIAACRAARASQGSVANAWADQATEWFEAWIEICANMTEDEWPPYEPLNALSITQWRYDPDVRELGEMLAAREADDPGRERWDEISEVVEEVREHVVGR